MISIAQRLRPFSHQPGTRCMIPGSFILVEIFPSLVRFFDYQGIAPQFLKEMIVDVEGPLNQFCVFLDLERACVTVVCDKVMFHILPNLEILFNKNPGTEPVFSKEKLSLGSHKKQEWERIKSRRDFREIFPLWFRLGNLLSLKSTHEKEGMFSLLRECEENILSHKVEEILFSFRKLFLAGFSGMLVPRLQDEEYQGISFSKTLPITPPVHLLTEGSALIRSLFFKMQETHFFLLPSLPPDFFAGRILNLATPYGELSMEWTKKMLRRIVFKASTDNKIYFHFSSSIKSCRVRTRLQDKGVHLFKGEGMEIKSGGDYLLDCFAK